MVLCDIASVGSMAKPFDASAYTAPSRRATKLYPMYVPVASIADFADVEGF